MRINYVEPHIRSACSQIGAALLDFWTWEGSWVAGEFCPQIHCRTDRGEFDLFVSSKGSYVLDAGGQQIALYPELTIREFYCDPDSNRLRHLWRQHAPLVIEPGAEIGVRRTSRNVHGTVDLAKWTCVFPLENERNRQGRGYWPGHSHLDGYCRVTSPLSLAVNEQIRRVIIEEPLAQWRVPSDVFVFGEGPPPHPAATKIGGIPYRPREQVWPKGAKSRPLTFLAQICFADSGDIVGALPDDVLLIFGEGQQTAGNCGAGEWDATDQVGLYFEWQPLRIDNPTREEDCPQTDWTLDEFFGVIHRTVDYPAIDPFMMRDGREIHAPTVMAATKIGGVPYWDQYPEEMPGTFLGMLTSFDPLTDVLFPFVNREDPLSADECHKKTVDSSYLQIGDMGHLYLFLETGTGKVIWSLQSG
jgi:hypothetical protein